MKAEKVQLTLPELAKCADDLANYLKVHPADDYTKAGSLLFLYVVSQAQVPPPETAAKLFAKCAEAIQLIIEDEMLLLQEAAQQAVDHAETE